MTAGAEMTLTHAIAVLEVAAAAARTNEPIHAGAGDFAQANLCADVADECRQAIAALRAQVQT